MSAEPDAGTHRVAVITDDEALAQLVREMLATMLPSIAIETVAIARAEMASTLPPAVASLAARPAGGDEELASVERDLRRMQQLIAMGEATARVQHTLNNPLTALLAEAQLLELEELAEEHRAAVRRIIELCRRMVGMVRALDPGTR